MCNYSLFKHCNFLISDAELKANYEHATPEVEAKELYVLF